MLKLALATYVQLPHLNEDDLLLKDELEKRGAMIECPIWDAPVDWSQFQND